MIRLMINSVFTSNFMSIMDTFFILRKEEKWKEGNFSSNDLAIYKHNSLYDIHSSFICGVG